MKVHGFVILVKKSVGCNPKFQFEEVTSTFEGIAARTSVFFLRPTIHSA